MALRLLTLLFGMQGDDCVYSFYVRTGSMIGAGTDSIISVRLSDKYSNTVEIANLKTWGGLMGKDYNYFERGNLDIFSGRGKCLNSTINALGLTPDRSAWYCSYVKIAAIGVNTTCSQQRFTVEQWLIPPRGLTAIMNYSPSEFDGQHPDRMIKKSSLISSVV